MTSSRLSLYVLAVYFVDHLCKISMSLVFTQIEHGPEKSKDTWASGSPFLPVPFKTVTEPGNACSDDTSGCAQKVTQAKDQVQLGSLPHDAPCWELHPGLQVG